MQKVYAQNAKTCSLHTRQPEVLAEADEIHWSESSLMLLVARSPRRIQDFVSAYLQLDTLPVPAGCTAVQSTVIRHSPNCYSFLTLLCTHTSTRRQLTHQTRIKATATDVYFYMKIPINRVNHPYHVQHGEMESADSVDS